MLLARVFAVPLILLAGSGSAAPAPPPASEEALAPGVRVRSLQGGFWLHVTARASDGVESNGLFAPLPGGGVLLVDTAWDDAQTETLLDFAARRLGGVRDAVVTHAHDDRTGGVGALRRRGVRPLGLDLTAEKARAEGSPVPDAALRARERVLVDPRGFEVFYPGPGHTLDNVVVAFPGARILAGGCLVKSAASGEGYMGEAYPPEWPAAIAALRERYAGYSLVVPGHGASGPLEPAFARTEALAREVAAREERATDGHVHADVPAVPDKSRRWLFYVHGRILELQGRDATSPDFGRYEFDAILKAFAGRGFEVISEVRTEQGSAGFPARLAEQVRRLRKAGVPAERITVVGASKGGFLTLVAAAELQHPGLSFVVLAGCGAESVAFGPRLRGRVLSIYDESDRFTPSCRATFEAAPLLTTSRELVLKLGHDHGLLYRPYPEWLEPAARWARGAAGAAESTSAPVSGGHEGAPVRRIGPTPAFASQVAQKLQRGRPHGVGRVEATLEPGLVEGSHEAPGEPVLDRPQAHQDRARARDREGASQAQYAFAVVHAAQPGVAGRQHDPTRGVQVQPGDFHAGQDPVGAAGPDGPALIGPCQGQAGRHERRAAPAGPVRGLVWSRPTRTGLVEPEPVTRHVDDVGLWHRQLEGLLGGLAAGQDLDGRREGPAPDARDVLRLEAGLG